MTILDGMSSFVAVVEQGSFTKAADMLGQTKSAVSKHVTKLEERLGVKLLNRTTRKLSLTDAGQNYYEKASAIIEQAEEAEAEITCFQAAPRGKLRVTMPIAFGQSDMKDILPAFMKEHPEIELDIFLSDQVVDLMGGNFDLAIRIGQLKDSSLIAKKLGSANISMVASPAYWKEHGKPEHPQDLQNHNCLLYSNAVNPRVWKFTCPDGQVETVRVNGNFQSNNGQLDINMALSGLGICQSPNFYCEEYIQSGQLEAVLDHYGKEEVGIYAVYLPARHVPTKIRAFIDFLADSLKGLHP